MGALAQVSRSLVCINKYRVSNLQLSLTAALTFGSKPTHSALRCLIVPAIPKPKSSQGVSCRLFNGNQLPVEPIGEIEIARNESVCFVSTATKAMVSVAFQTCQACKSMGCLATHIPKISRRLFPLQTCLSRCGSIVPHFSQIPSNTDKNVMVRLVFLVPPQTK